MTALSSDRRISAVREAVDHGEEVRHDRRDAQRNDGLRLGRVKARGRRREADEFGVLKVHRAPLLGREHDCSATKLIPAPPRAKWAAPRRARAGASPQAPRRSLTLSPGCAVQSHRRAAASRCLKTAKYQAAGRGHRHGLRSLARPVARKHRNAGRHGIGGGARLLASGRAGAPDGARDRRPDRARDRRAARAQRHRRHGDADPVHLRDGPAHRDGAAARHGRGDHLVGLHHRGAVRRARPCRRRRDRDRRPRHGAQGRGRARVRRGLRGLARGRPRRRRGARAQHSGAAPGAARDRLAGAARVHAVRPVDGGDAVGPRAAQGAHRRRPRPDGVDDRLALGKRHAALDLRHALSLRRRAAGAGDARPVRDAGAVRARGGAQDDRRRPRRRHQPVEPVGGRARRRPPLVAGAALRHPRHRRSAPFPASARR